MAPDDWQSLAQRFVALALWLWTTFVALGVSHNRWARPARATNRWPRPARATMRGSRIVGPGWSRATIPEPQTPLANLAGPGHTLLRLATVGRVPTLLTVANSSKMVAASLAHHLWLSDYGSGRLAKPGPTICGSGIVALDNICGFGSEPQSLGPASQSHKSLAEASQSYNARVTNRWARLVQSNDSRAA